MIILDDDILVKYQNRKKSINIKILVLINRLKNFAIRSDLSPLFYELDILVPP